MDDTEFQKKVLENQAAQKNDVDTLIKNYDQLDKQTKSAMEEFTAAKNKFVDVEEISRKMQKLAVQLHHEKRQAFGNPVERLARNEDFRRAFMAKFVIELGLRDILKGSAVMKDLDTTATPGSSMIANAELEREVYDALLSFGAFKNLDVRSIGAKATEIRLKTARAAMVFVDEAVAIGADATKAGSKVSVTPKKIAGLISVSTELEEDDVVGVTQDILNDFLEAWAYRLDHISFTANGVANTVDGGFTGMFYGGTAKVAAAGNVSVATLDYEDVLACITGVDPAVLQRGVGKWFIHPTILAKLMLIKSADGRPIFNTALEAPSFGAMGTIFGFPVVMVGAAPSTDAVSAKIAAFGDPFNQGVRIRKDFKFDRSDQWAFDTDEVTFRATGRGASKTKIATLTTVLTTAAA